MKYITHLRETLEYLISHPTRPAIRTFELPFTISNEVRRRILAQAIDKPRSKIAEFQWEITETGHLPEWLNDRYRALIRTGISDDECIRELIKKIIWENTHINDYYIELTDQAQFFYDIYINDLVEIDEVEYDLLFYAINNHLCHYSEDKWILTSLGHAFLRIPKLQGVRFLLSLETYLNTKKYDRWHMPRLYLELLLRERTFSRISSDRPYLSEFDNEKLYSYRIQGFGLATESGDDSDIMTLTSFGQSCIESVLASDSIFDLLVPIYIREEMVGSAASQYSKKEDIDRLKSLLDKSPIVGDQKEPLLVEVDRLIRTDEAYLSIFKALAPCIEGILRNITNKEAIEVSGFGIKAYKNAISGASPQILKHGTLEMIDAVFRPYRNIVEHGHVIAPEPARMLCEVTLAVIEQIHRDYFEFIEG